jgi:hypothetical protein
MATNIEIAALGEANLATNNVGNITALKMRETFGAMLDHLGGNIYLVNSSTTPQSATADIPLTLTNDGAGALTVITKRPHYITPSVFLSGNKIHFDELIDGTMINVRLEMAFTTGANTAIEIEAIFKDSGGTEAFRLQFEDLFYKEAKTHKKVSNFQFFMDDNITDGTLEFAYTSDSNSTALWKSIMADIR